MKNMDIEQLINEYVNNESVEALDELTKRMIFDKLDVSDTTRLFFTDNIGIGIKRAIIKFGGRKSLISILQNSEEDYLFTDLIIDRLSYLYQDEAETLLLTEGYYKKNTKAFIFALKNSDISSILELLKKQITDDFGYGTKEIIRRKLEKSHIITTEVADGILMLNKIEFVTHEVIQRCSKKALVKCLELNPIIKEEIIDCLTSGKATKEEAEFILNSKVLESNVILYAIRYASKETLLKYYPKQQNMEIIDACLNRLYEIVVE